MAGQERARHLYSQREVSLFRLAGILAVFSSLSFSYSFLACGWSKCCRAHVIEVCCPHCFLVIFLVIYTSWRRPTPRVAACAARPRDGDELSSKM
ncbi:hypothetical protein IWZ01DRAFT_512019 [Phyllosticta capitalensis]